ncbi:MAG: hypothetical protein ACK54X_00340 [Burkholderiales bacterium]|jgi:hypothetical protein
MNTKAPAIALRRREAALRTFRTKLDVLERLLTDDTLDRFPERASVSAFASWRDEALGVDALSRSALYADEAEYLELRRRMEHLLERVVQRRARGTRRANVEATLRQRLAEAEERAQSYVNQYSMVRAELLAVRAENTRLRQKLQRFTEGSPNVVRLKAVRPDGETGRSDGDE